MTTDPKLIEKAKTTLEKISDVNYRDKSIDSWNIAEKIIEKALHQHGEEVRRATIEECLKICSSIRCADGNQDLETGASLASQLIAKSIRRLLEEK